MNDLNPTPNPVPHVRAERLLRAVADELRQGLGVERLSTDLVADVYARLKDLLPAHGRPDEADLAGSWLVHELALAIYLVAASWGRGAQDPKLLLFLERALARALADLPPPGGTPATSAAGEVAGPAR